MTTLSRIRSLCQRHAHPGVNPGAHELARKVLAEIGPEIVPTSTGKFEIHLTEGTVITSRDGLGLSKEEAEEILDYLETSRAAAS